MLSPCVPVRGGSAVLLAGQDRSHAGFWKERRGCTLILRLTGDKFLLVSGPHTAYLAMGKQASGVADPAVMSWCR